MLQKIVNQLKASEFFRNLLTLMTGTGLAALITVFSAPFITRLYSPEDFGGFALFFSMATIIGSIACLRYEVAIVLPRFNFRAVQLVALSLIFCIGASFLSLLGVIFFGSIIAELLGQPEITPYLYFLPVLVLGTGLQSIMMYFSNRHKQYKALSGSKVLTSFCGAGGKLGFGLAGAGPLGLIAGQIIGVMAGCLTIWGLMWSHLKRSLSRLSYAALKRQALKYNQYPVFNLPSVFLNNLATQAPILLFGVFYSAESLGLISFTVQIILFSLNFFVRSYSSVFYQKIAVTSKKSHILNVFWKSVILLACIGAAFVLSLWILPENLFGWVFGQGWENLKYYMNFFAVSVFFQLISSPVSSLIMRCGKNDLFFLYQIFNVGVVTLSICIPSLLGFPVETTFVLFVCARSVSYFVYFFLCRYVIEFVK